MKYCIINKVRICVLLAIFTFSSACAGKEEKEIGEDGRGAPTETISPEATPVAAVGMMQEDEGKIQGEIEAGEDGRQEREVREDVTWSKHAFLLEDEDVFFACMPDNWKSTCKQEKYHGMNYVMIYFPTTGTVSTDERTEYVEFYVGQKKREVESPEEFIFADGQAGRRWGVNNPTIFSADAKYIFETNYNWEMSDCQYEEYLKYTEKFYGSMIFQNAQIGLQQKQSLKERDKVRFHAYMESLWLDVTVPEGIEFHISDLYGDWLILDLDGGYVRLVYDPDAGEIGEDFWEERGKVLTDETYEEEASYGVSNWEGCVCYLYGFIHPESIYAEIQVPEDDAEMLEAALDIVRSIRFR